MEKRGKKKEEEEKGDVEARDAKGNVAVQPAMTNETECAIFVSGVCWP